MGGGAGTTGNNQAEVFGMRRKGAISRFAALVFATLACLLLAVLAPMFFGQRATDEPFSGYAVMASPRDMHVIAAPIRLSDAPDLTLNRGTLYADGNAAAGTPISRFVLDGPVFQLNASGLRASASSFESSLESTVAGTVAPLLVEQLVAMGFDALTLRQGTLHVTTADGVSETISDIQAELTGKRKGQVAAHGSFAIRGQRLGFDTTLSLPADKSAPPRWPVRLALKGDLLEAAFDGHLNVAEDLQLSGPVELSTPSLRRIARWFGLPVATADGLNAAAVKGQINWARQAFAVEDAKIVIDGNEAAGALVLNLAGERPLIGATLAFHALDLTPYAEAARSQSFLFDRQSATWSLFDLSFPLIRYVDADLRISAPKVALKGFGLGHGAATIAVRSGKLLADIAELELYGGKASAQITANSNEIVPRYTLRGKVEGFDAGPAGAAAVRRSRADRPLDTRRRHRRHRADADRGAAQAVGQGNPHHARRRPGRHGHEGPAHRGKGQRSGGLGAAGQGTDQSRAGRGPGGHSQRRAAYRAGASPRRHHGLCRIRARGPGRAHPGPSPCHEARRSHRSAAQGSRHGGSRGRDDAGLLARAVRAR